MASLVIGAVGGAAAIGLMEVLSILSSHPLAVVPFASSIVTVMGAPDALAAQPRAIVGGHLIATLTGLVALHVGGPFPWVAAAAVGLSIVAMQASRAFHPPAGIDPLIVVLYDMPWNYFISPVAIGTLLLTAFAFAWNNVMRRQSWPAQWY